MNTRSSKYHYASYKSLGVYAWTGWKVRCKRISLWTYNLSATSFPPCICLTAEGHVLFGSQSGLSLVAKARHQGLFTIFVAAYYHAILLHSIEHRLAGLYLRAQYAEA